MRLDQYQWSRNPRGLHVQRVLITPLDIERWARPQFGWVKLIAAEGEYIDDAQEFMRRGITPIVRMFRGEWGARPMDRALRLQYEAYLRAGVRWFEFYNEPNLGVEWPPGTQSPDWRNPAMIIPLMDNWLTWAEFIISRGGYPGFIPLAESDDPKESSVRWMDAFLTYLAQTHFDRFRNVLAGGMYVATHPYILNHYYQEEPGGGPFSARPPQAQNAREGGWHFEYPYDPVSQRDDPGRTVYGGTPLTPNGDPVGLLAMGRMFNERAAAMFGARALPVVGTEGGIWPFPRQNQPSLQQDTRYPAYDHDGQAQATVAMFEWIARQAPPWFFGVTLWKEDDYYYPDGGKARAIDLLTDTPPLLKAVPAQDVMADGFVPGVVGAVPGPAPIHGQADFHMVLIAPGLEERWFFDAAESYWDAFRPIVTTNMTLIDFIPNERSLAVTLIVQPNLVETIAETINMRYPNVHIDLVIAEDFDRVAEQFATRAESGLPLGLGQ